MKTNSALIIPSAPSDTNTEALAFNPAPKPPLSIPDYTLPLCLLGGALLAAGLWYLWRRTRPAPQPVVVPPIPPHVLARRKLEAALTHISEPKEFSVMVSEALRVYLEDRFQFHAPDRTTEEFLVELQSSSLLTDEQKQSLAQFLSICDLIKFAKLEPTEVELLGLHEAALRLVNETEPSEIVADNPAGPESAASQAPNPQ
jgi:hypothetical protein